MDENIKDEHSRNALNMFLVLQLVPLSIGLFLLVVRNWAIAAVVFLLFVAMDLFRYKSVLFGKDIPPSLINDLENRLRFISLVLKELFLLAVFVLSLFPIFLVTESTDNALYTRVDVLNLAGSFYHVSSGLAPWLSIILASFVVILFLTYLYHRWKLVPETTLLSVMAVLSSSAIAVFFLVSSFTMVFAANGIVDTNEKDNASNGVLKVPMTTLRQGNHEITSDIHETMQTITYFSVVTFTTLGYGDFQPTKESRAFAAIEAVSGMVFMSFLVAVFFAMLREMLEPNKQQTRPFVPALLVGFLIVVISHVGILFLIDAFTRVA